MPVKHRSPSPDELVSRTTCPTTLHPPSQNGDVPFQMHPSPTTKDVSYVKCVRCPSRPLFCLQREKHSIRSFTKLREVIQINTNGRSNYWFVLCSDQNTHWKHEEQENLEHTKSRKHYNRLETEYCNIPYRYVCETHFFFGRGDVYTDNHFQQSHQVNWMPNEKSRGNL